MKRSTLFGTIGIVVVAGVAAFASQAARQPLFTAAPAQTARASDTSYSALAGDRATIGLQLVQADAGQIAETSDTLQLSLDGQDLIAYKSAFVSNPDGTQVWQGQLGKAPSLFGKVANALSGEIRNDPKNSVVIVRNGGKLTGTVRVDGELYALRPLLSGGHALARIDESRMPPDHPQSYGLLPKIEMPKSPNVGANAVGPLANTVIRVMVVATQSAISASGDIVGLANLAVAESNTGYSNSGVTITLQLAGTYSTTYVESGSFSTDLTRFRTNGDGYMDNVHAIRNTITADVMMLIINNASSCGLASGIGSTAATAFAVAHYSCATGYYSFAHEIGHLQSARHDIATDPTLTPYAYGHGYRSPTNAWRTIMAYNCTTGCPRINYWSNPAKTYGGQAMGNTTRAHNQRVLNATAATVAAFR